MPVAKAVNPPSQDWAPVLDPTFRALADPTRLAVIERLCHGTASMSELAQPLPMKLPSVMKHLDILENAGLVKSEKRGRVRTYSVVPEKLRVAEHWLEKQRRIWEQRLDRLDAYLITMKE
jgi:DNA-binding transcriptional ArsR family regulator